MHTLIHNFDNPGSTQDWHPINDGVMGGVSTSRLTFDLAGHAVFEGDVSLQNGGGFASVRMSSLQLGSLGTRAYLVPDRKPIKPNNGAGSHGFHRCEDFSKTML